MTVLENTFIGLVKLGIGTSNKVNIPPNTEWNALMELSWQQGLSAVVLDGISKLKEKEHPPKILLLQWIGRIIQTYENRHALYREAIRSLAEFYNAHGFKMMVLKGYGCSLDWPKPEHRPCGDIDIWQFGKYKEADALLSKEKSIEIDFSHHHHTVFNWGGFMIENHYDFIDVHHRKSSPKLEAVLKKTRFG